MSYYHLWGTDIRVPLAGYRGDSVGLLLEVNNYVRGGNIHSMTIWGAPNNASYRNVMADYAMMLPTLKLFWFLTGSVEAAVNIQAIFNNLILGISMYIVCIRLHLGEKMSLVSSILLPNVSFLVLGYNAIMMTYVYCFYLPFFVYYIIKLMLPEEENQQEKIKFSEIAFLMLFMFLTGINSLYYAFLCLIILAFVGVYALCGTKSVKNTLLVMLSYISIGYGIAVCIMPNILYSMGIGAIWDSGMYYILTTVVGGVIVGFVFLFYKKVYPKMTMKKLLLLLCGVALLVCAALVVIKKFTNYLGEYEGRSLYAVELGALNIVNLFLPAANNVISGLDTMVAALTDIDNPVMCDSTEMGIFTGIGLFYSFLHIFPFKETLSAKDEHSSIEEDNTFTKNRHIFIRNRDKILEVCGKCNAFMILLAVKGGLASVIATYVTTGIRNYNRVCIMIMIFSLISFGILVEKIMEKVQAVYVKEKRMVLSGMVVAAVLAGILISVPTDYIYDHNFGLVHYEQRKTEYDEWQQIMNNIENSVEKDTMVLEFPSPVDKEHMGELMTVGRAYELSIPAITSKSTIWSYGSRLETELDFINDTEEYIALAKEKGFGGIYLDILMFADTSFEEYIITLEKYLGAPDVSDGYRRYFWQI